MCWQPISLKDPSRLYFFGLFSWSFFSPHFSGFQVDSVQSDTTNACWDSQELLDGVEQERHLRLNPARNATIFHHPTLGDFELQHVC